jgi:heat shock protein HslJ
MNKKAAVSGCMMLFVMFLISCNGKKPGAIMSAPVAAGIEDMEWRLIEVSSAPVSPIAGEKQPHIKLDPVRKQAAGFAGCNNFFGGYELDGSSLKFGPIGSTRMFCPDLQMSLETEVLKALEMTRAWKITGGDLLLFDDSEVLACLTTDRGEKNNAEISGTAWQWVHTLYNDDRKVVPADPKNYTVQFQEDGTLSVKADCNQKGGTYSVEEKRLSIEITQSTMAACPEDSLEDELVRGLTAAAIYFIKDNDLYIDLIYDTGTMRFSKQKE